MEELSGIVISFDLSMDMLDIYFEGGRNNRSKAYSSIRKYLLSQGYEALDDSDYKNDKDTLNRAINKLKAFCEVEKWFPLCIKKIIITPNSLYSDYTDIIHDEIDISYKEKQEAIYQMGCDRYTRG